MRSTLGVTTPAVPRYRAYTRHALPAIAKRYGLSRALCDEISLISHVVPFRVNSYVLENLIDWADVPDDPIFRMLFPSADMLAPEDVAALRDAGPRIGDVARSIQSRLNPHPAGQRELNVPVLDGDRVPGLQHMYRETVLYFPSAGQTCHAFCSFCFRWPQFTGSRDWHIAASGTGTLVRYLGEHPEVQDVLVTGGDPFMMSSDLLRRDIDELLTVPTLRTIRLGTKAMSYWPFRVLSDRDSTALLETLELVSASDKTLALMLHVTHPRELETPDAARAVSVLRRTGAMLYGQAPMMNGVNADPATLSALWTREATSGITPYYLFLARDTGGRTPFAVPLVPAARIFRKAISSVDGLARTVRGPAMSTTAGKLLIDGVVEPSEPSGTRLSLRFVQARDPAVVGRPFTALCPAGADWADALIVDPSPTPPDITAAMSAIARPAGPDRDPSHSGGRGATGG
jgi:L-lysine 2,3-aminomutase